LPADGTSPAVVGLIVREPDALHDDLLVRLRRGDSRAFEDLVRTYQHRVFGVGLRMLGSRAEAEEIAQETFLRAHRALADFRGEARLGTWLYGIAARLCLNRLASSERRHPRADDDALDRVPANVADAATALERTELEAALHQAIAELPDERRIVVVLRDVEGLAYEEIAEALGLELGTVRSRLHRARTELKAKLERFLP
jgi:RNA polymerase sigma-70 factor (ECF subfamily)